MGDAYEELMESLQAEREAGRREMKAAIARARAEGYAACERDVVSWLQAMPESECRAACTHYWAGRLLSGAHRPDPRKAGGE